MEEEKLIEEIIELEEGAFEVDGKGDDESE